jgi:pilus assembly protein CpaF
MVAQVRDAVLSEAAPVTGARLAAAVQSTGRLLGSEGAFRTLDRVRAELQGLGPLQRFAEDPAVTDILVNGPGAVWVDDGGGLQRTDLSFSGEADVRALATRLVAAGGRRLDDSNPCVDVRLDCCQSASSGNATSPSMNWCPPARWTPGCPRLCARS